MRNRQYATRCPVSSRWCWYCPDDHGQLALVTPLVRADWTTTQIYSLSEKTRTSSRISEEIKVVVFMTPQTSMYDQVQELLSATRRLPR